MCITPALHIASKPNTDPALALYSIPAISWEYLNGVPTTEETTSFGKDWSENPTFRYADPLSRTKTGEVSTEITKKVVNLSFALFYHDYLTTNLILNETDLNL